MKWGSCVLVVGMGLLASCAIDEKNDRVDPETKDADAEKSVGHPDEGRPDAGVPVVSPDGFAAGEIDVETAIRTADDRKPISPLIYGINEVMPANPAPPAVLAIATFVRRGGDRANAYNWETNLSASSIEGGFSSDFYLAEGLQDPNAPATVDLTLIRKNHAEGRGTMVPFVLNGWVASKAGSSLPYDNPAGWDRDAFFDRVEVVKPSPFSAKPIVDDGVVYTDEHLDFMKRQFSDDVFAPGPRQVMVGIDNEPDLYAYNFPMLQDGGGEALYAANGVKIGNRLTPVEFIERFLTFARRVKELAPTAPIVGPSHYHFDGFTHWNTESLTEYSSSADGHWFMDDFLSKTKAASEAKQTRLLDTWDFHWYPQHMDGGKFVWSLDQSVRPLTDEEIEHIVQSPRSYWDPDYDEDSWITRDHLHAPANILNRLEQRIDAAYPGTHLGVSEYFPGGCAHIASGLAVADSLGVFARMGIHLAAMWPTCARLEFAYGALKLLRNFDDKGGRFADTVVRVDHPEKRESSVYAGSDDPSRVTVLIVNKTNAARRVGLRIFGAQKLSHVAVHRMDRDHADPHLAAEESLSKTNAYAYAAPPLTASELVFDARGD